MTIPTERQRRCDLGLGGCGAIIDMDHACRFDNGPHKADTLLCATCCPNCYGGTGHGPVGRMPAAKAEEAK